MVTMDTEKLLAHQPRNVRDLAQAAQAVWSAYQDEEQLDAPIANLGQALSAFALGSAMIDPRRSRRNDPRRATPR